MGKIEDERTPNANNANIFSMAYGVRRMMEQSHHPSIRQTAITAYHAGVCVVPVLEDGTKRLLSERMSRASLVPLVGDDVAGQILNGSDFAFTWKHFQYVRPSAEQMGEWFGPDSERTGIGAICGTVSGNLEMLEFENIKIYEQFVQLAIDAGLGPIIDKIRDGYEETTPGGGIHWFYRCETIAGNTPLARRRISNGANGSRVETLIETRGEGGFAVIAPSYGGVHETGKPYQLLRGGLDQIAELDPSERDDLWDHAGFFDDMPRRVYNEPKPKDPAEVGTRPGDKWAAATTWEEILEPHGWRYVFSRGDVAMWRRPGKDRGISATTNYGNSDLFYVFSSSTDFEPERSYTKFGAYALLNHGGEWRAATRALVREGYGSPEPTMLFPDQPRNKDGEHDGDEKKEDPPHTDTGNAERLVRQYGEDIRYDWTRKVWLVWDGTRWKVDRGLELGHMSKLVARSIRKEALDMDANTYIKVSKFAIKSEQENSRNAMVNLAKKEPEVKIENHQLDSDHWLLNVNNGMVDLKTGELLPHDRAQYCTKIVKADYNPDATCPQFDQFLETIFDGQQDAIDYLWRALGYSLTGSIREQCFFLCHGTGANGKSTLLVTFRKLLGDYATETDAEAFMDHKSDGRPNDQIAALAGARFVSASETSDGKRISEALIKKLTGGETVTARRLYQNSVQFDPTFKIWLGTNHRPSVIGQENAIWRRIRYVPFEVTVPPEKRDPELINKLETERDGILARAVRGALEWQRGGLQEPERFRQATEEYRREEDIIGDWIEDRCWLGDKHEEENKYLYSDYKRWCEQNEIKPIQSNTFGKRMLERGLELRRSSGKRIRMGIELRIQGV